MAASSTTGCLLFSDQFCRRQAAEVVLTHNSCLPACLSLCVDICLAIAVFDVPAKALWSLDRTAEVQQATSTLLHGFAT